MTDAVNRRKFIGATGTALSVGLGIGATGDAAALKSGYPSFPAAGAVYEDIAALVAQKPFIDTHEHLPPEAERINHKDQDRHPAPDFGMLFSHYTDSDLQVSGMAHEDFKQLIGRSLTPKEKWKLVAPWYDRCRHTGYQRCVRESIRALYDEDDISESNCEKISEQLSKDIRPGFYRHILRHVAHIEHAHVNGLESSVFRESESADDLISFDLWIVSISSGLKLRTLRRYAEGDLVTLDQAHKTIDRIFEKFGPKAIAVKNQSAYGRRLDYAAVSDEDAAPLFQRLAQDESLNDTEMKALQDNLFRHVLHCATAFNLPVKLHTGYFAGHNVMDLARVRENLCDIARLAQDFPNTIFVLMHIAYPYQHELIALCKHYANIYADMCWSWIIDPASASRFLGEFMMAAPACKLFTFGGDYIPVELVAGHARMARQGISRVIARLVAERWLDASDVPALVERIMRGNAKEVFDHERVLRAPYPILRPRTAKFKVESVSPVCVK
ncbi:MAG: amidohydrolase family protein [Candidatus Hydrogenedentales bacterium]|jgi:predicted TIM-barrel fold metal-dependent hydrolase